MRQPEQVVATGTAGLQGGGVDEGPDVAQRMHQLLVGLPGYQRVPLVRCVQPEDHPDRGGLAGAVRADEPGHPARHDGEGHAVEGLRPTEPLA